jgi:uncharacterized membrane protein
MSGSDSIFIYIGTYANEDLARGDYEVVKDLHWAGEVGSYDAAVITKDDTGKVHVNKDESATRKGAWGGIAAGAVVGLLFPPTIIGSALIGAAVGGVGGHLWKGMSRSDVKELGEFIDAGEACLLVIGESTIEDAVAKTEFKSDRHVQKKLDVNSTDIDSAVKETAKQLS